MKELRDIKEIMCGIERRIDMLDKSQCDNRHEIQTGLSNMVGQVEQKFVTFASRIEELEKVTKNILSEVHRKLEAFQSAMAMRSKLSDCEL